MLTSLLSTVRPHPETYTLALHDALPISARHGRALGGDALGGRLLGEDRSGQAPRHGRRLRGRDGGPAHPHGLRPRSEEHTSELQSRRDLVCRLLLEKKKINIIVHLSNNR